MLAYIDLEQRVAVAHPLRTIKRLADEALADRWSTFDGMYARDGGPSIPPERLLKASLLIALYSARSERAFCEELEYNLLLRWFLDMDPIEPRFDPTVFTKNRERLLKHEVGQQLFDEAKEGRCHPKPLGGDKGHDTRTASTICASGGSPRTSPAPAIQTVKRGLLRSLLVAPGFAAA